MNETLIQNWNSVVSKDDNVLCLGDFCYTRGLEMSPKQYVERLNGHIHILFGNHDNPQIFRNCGFASMREGYWDYKHDMLEPPYNRVFLCHYPMLSWNGSFHGRPHLYGHVHSNAERSFGGQRNSYDVGVDNNDFRPINLKTLLEKLREDYPETKVG